MGEHRIQCGGWTLSGTPCKHTRIGEPGEVWFCGLNHKRQQRTGIYRLQCENRPYCYLIGEYVGFEAFQAAIKERNEHYGCCSHCSPRNKSPEPPQDFMAELQALTSKDGKYDRMMADIQAKLG